MDPTSIGDLIWRPLKLAPQKVALEFGDCTQTYSELDDRANRVAAVLLNHGVGKGDRVLLLYPNELRFVEMVLGIARAGAVCVMGNIRLGDEVLAYVGEHSGAVALITHATLADKAAAARPSSREMRVALVAGGSVPGMISYEDALDEAEWNPKLTADVSIDDMAWLLYTSGSSGLPKGCMLSHSNTWWQARSSVATGLLTEDDKGLVSGPLYHANGLWACMLPMMYIGGTLVILDEFSAPRVLDAIERYRPSFTSGTPSMYTLLLAALQRSAPRDVSSLDLLMCGSAAAPEELLTALGKEFGCDVVERYGLTEGGGNLETPRWGVKKIGSAGLPAPGVEIRIADLTHESEDCRPGCVGELWTRSGANALGYLNDPERTAERFRSDGWLLTGDLAYRDDQGYVFVSGRRDDMINVGGENVYPKEIESVLLTHPQVIDVCVVPARHATKGEAPVAWVVCEELDSVSETELKEYFIERSAPYAHPRRVFFRAALPMSGTNKIDRAKLKEETDRLVPLITSSSAGAEATAENAEPHGASAG